MALLQDVRRLGHFEHERRAAAREIVGGADAREDAIHGPQHGAPRGHEAADVRENDDERRLPHVGALAAHVRAGDDQHAARLVEAQIVRNEGLAAGALDHRMAAALDQQHRLLDQLGLRAIERRGALGEAGQHVDLARSAAVVAAAPAGARSG